MRNKMARKFFVLAVAGSMLAATARGGSDAAPSFPQGGAQRSSGRPAPAPELSFAEARKLVVAGRKYVAHPRISGAGEATAPGSDVPDGFEIATPPPAPRAESRPASPGPGLVWVPGHYMPVKGEWRWVRGEWAGPATPASVWIQGQYDAEKKTWSPGYWQPDRPAPAEVSAKDGAGTAGY